jgi:hypothetical protein
VKIKYLLLFLVLLSLLASTVGAEDGVLFRRNISKTPEQETEKAAIYMMDFYVPAQASDGTVGPIDNYEWVEPPDDGFDYGPREYAKPLVTVYIDNLPENEGLGNGGLGSFINGGMGFGQFDGYVGVSLDDGTSWKTGNLSRSADLSSFTLDNGHPYPGDVHNIVHQVAGDRIFVAWVSKYCDGGTPLYTLDPTDDASYFEDLTDTYGLDPVYLYDLFGVAGNQDSVDYTLQGFPEIGEIPYSCVWTARGKVVYDEENSLTDVLWTKPERLTSGRRDANLPAVDCAAGAGCILTWQEDPEGLRPGQGLGPGEGWSGAIANQQTDIWYSYIDYDDFDDVMNVDNLVVPLEEYTGDTMPKPYVPMAMPVRLTDNAMCKDSGNNNPSPPYCYIDFDTVDDLDPDSLPTEPEQDADFCDHFEEFPNPGGTTLNVCITQDNRMLNGRVASTRVRLNLKPYDADPAIAGFESAWVVMAYEETKALGYTGDDDNDIDPIDIGKDVWYHSFDMFNPNLVAQGGMLNQPAICNPYDAGNGDCTEGELYPLETDDRGYEFYLTEISRRFALTTNSVEAADYSVSGLSAMLIYKQGIINQGGPADIFLRRVIIPDTFEPDVDNPYAYENMECVHPDGISGWVYPVDAEGNPNPNYLQGLCLAPAINISGSTIVECDGGTDNDICAGTFPWDGGDQEFPKVYEWRQCDGVAAIDGCDNNNDPLSGDLDDQSWENPFDVAKGHRGFLDGDIVMIMYAWAPNWKANSVGNDHYNLYVRRSFDGGATWTTTPSALDGIGTTAIEWYGLGGDAEPTEWVYEAGAFEQARNVSQLVGNKITVLDPRYTPAGGLKLYNTISADWLTENVGEPTQELPYDDDVRVSDKFYVVYETGDNTTVAEGEAVPLDLFYSRATVYGDVYELMEYPNYDGEIERWPWLENKQDDLSGEASIVTNPGATFMYAVWNQWKEEIADDGHELIYDSDIIFRRLMYYPDDDVDRAPWASIFYYRPGAAGYSPGGDIFFVGSARDRDYMGEGIVAYQWHSSLNGVLSTEKYFTVPVTDLDLGLHTISFTAQDNEGNWAPEVSIRFLVTEELTELFTPFIVR